MAFQLQNFNEFFRIRITFAVYCSSESNNCAQNFTPETVPKNYDPTLNVYRIEKFMIGLFFTSTGANEKKDIESSCIRMANHINVCFEKIKLK